MRNLKKVLSLVLCMAMMLSIMVVGAGAAFKDQSKIVNEEAVDMCAALNIINGYTDGSFKPEGTITRAEACKMICVALNGGKEPVLGTNATPTFTDIKGHWAEKYIEYCVSLGVVAGVGGGKFAPNGNVTGSQFAKMLLIALGYSADTEKFTGAAWEVNVNVRASQKDLYEDLETMDPSVALTRDNAAQMVWNALNAEMVEYDYKLSTVNGSLTSEMVVKNTGETLLADKYNTKDTDDTTGTLTGMDYDSDNDEYTYTVAGVKYVTEADYTDLLGHDVTVVVQKKTDKVFGMFANEGGVVASGVMGDIDDEDYATDKTLEIAGVDYDADGVKYAVYGYANGYYTYTTGKALNDANKYDSFVAIDNDDDKDIDLIIYYPVVIAEVGYVGSDYVKMVKDSTKYDEDYTIYEGIAKEDDVTIVPDTSLKTKAIIAELETLNGTVESYDGEEVVIDGTTYSYKEKAGTTTEKPVEIEGNLDKTVDFRVVNGYIVYAEGAAAADVSDYAVVTKIAPAAGLNEPQAKLLLSDGTTMVVDLAEDYTVTGQDGKAKIPVGSLVTYDEDDGEYTLEVVTTLTGYDNDKQVKTGISATAGNAWNAAEKGKTNAAITIGNVHAKIAADAVIFVQDGTDYSVKTGADLAKVTDDATVYYAGAEKNSTNALTVTFAYVATEGAVSTDTQYGYVTSGITTKTIDGDSYYVVTVWNGAPVTLTIEKDSKLVSTLAKGNVISYVVNSDGYAEDIADVDYEIGAISVIDGDTLYINGEKVTVDEEDTTMFFINSKDKKGDEAGKLSIAYDAEDPKDEDGYVDNVWYVVDRDDKDKTLILIIGDCINETGIVAPVAAE